MWVKWGNQDAINMEEIESITMRGELNGRFLIYFFPPGKDHFYTWSFDTGEACTACHEWLLTEIGVKRGDRVYERKVNPAGQYKPGECYLDEGKLR